MPFNITTASLVSIVAFVTIFGYHSQLMGAESNDLSIDAKPYGKTLESGLKNIGNGILGCHQEISPKMLIPI